MEPEARVVSVPGTQMPSETHIYCLKCRQPQRVVNPQRQATKFESRKTRPPMTRMASVGTRSVGGRRVSRFAKQ